jgi:PAS domain S-box-containing protein
MAIVRPTPTDKEVFLNPEKTIVSKTNNKGIILYANSYFIEISGYSVGELMSKPHNIIRHPDMPKVVFELLWQSIKAKQNMHAVVKNLSKDGSFYWVMTDFKVDVNPETENIVAIQASRKAVPRDILPEVQSLYKNLLEIEKEVGLTASIKYLGGFLDENNMSYNEWVLNLLEKSAPKEETKKGFFGKMFGGSNNKKGNFFSNYFKS